MGSRRRPATGAAGTNRRAGAEGTALRVLIALDGSPSAQAAVLTTRSFPWPPATLVRGVVVSPADWVRSASGRVRRALGQTLEHVAAGARRTLTRRWPDADVVTVSGRPADGILGEGRRWGADVIVVGWRGHGTFRRLLAGSVSRSIVAGAPGPVLVVRRPVRDVRRIVVGIDGSPNAGEAIRLAARLVGEPGRAVVVRVVQPVVVPTGGLMPASVRAQLRGQAARMNRQLQRRARRDAESAAALLRRAGWAARGHVRAGAPLATLLEVVRESEADLLILGARARRGLRRVALGSVAAGALDRSPVPVLVVR